MTALPVDESPNLDADTWTVEPHVESWRVVVAGSREHTPIADATIRLRVGEQLVLANGEACDVYGALDDAVQTGVQLLDAQHRGAGPDGYDRLRTECRLASPGRDTAVPGVTAAVVHQNGLLSRLAAVLNAHEVTHFSYTLVSDGSRAEVAVSLGGSQWDVRRVANKLRRVVGVLRVVEQECSI